MMTWCHKIKALDDKLVEFMSVTSGDFTILFETL